MPPRRTIAPVIAACLALSASAAVAQQQRPPRPDFGALAAAVNVPESALAACMAPSGGAGQRPVQGQRPPRPDASAIASCLAEAGHGVKVAKLDEALRKAAPPPRN